MITTTPSLLPFICSKGIVISPFLSSFVPMYTFPIPRELEIRTHSTTQPSLYNKSHALDHHNHRIFIKISSRPFPFPSLSSSSVLLLSEKITAQSENSPSPSVPSPARPDSSPAPPQLSPGSFAGNGCRVRCSGCRGGFRRRPVQVTSSVDQSYMGFIHPCWC